MELDLQIIGMRLTMESDLQITGIGLLREFLDLQIMGNGTYNEIRSKISATIMRLELFYIL